MVKETSIWIGGTYCRVVVVLAQGRVSYTGCWNGYTINHQIPTGHGPLINALSIIHCRKSIPFQIPSSNGRSSTRSTIHANIAVLASKQGLVVRYLGACSSVFKLSTNVAPTIWPAANSDAVRTSTMAVKKPDSIASANSSGLYVR